MKHLTIATLLALFTSAALAETNNSGVVADFYRGAASCDADVASPQAQINQMPTRTTISQAERPAEVNCAITPYVGVCSEQD